MMGAHKPYIASPDGLVFPSATAGNGPFNGIKIYLDNDNSRAEIKDLVGNFPLIKVPAVLTDTINLLADGSINIHTDGTNIIFRVGGLNLMKLKPDGDLCIRGNYNSGGQNW
jgi:hypothetical protein